MEVLPPHTQDTVNEVYHLHANLETANVNANVSKD